MVVWMIWWRCPTRMRTKGIVKRMKSDYLVDSMKLCTRHSCIHLYMCTWSTCIHAALNSSLQSLRQRYFLVMPINYWICCTIESSRSDAITIQCLSGILSSKFYCDAAEISPGMWANNYMYHACDWSDNRPRLCVFFIIIYIRCESMVRNFKKTLNGLGKIFTWEFPKLLALPDTVFKS